MSSVRELHNQAMEYAQLALIARHQGETQRAIDLARQAYQYEIQATALVPEGQAAEPTRSIMYRSAASLAYQCKAYEEALRLIAQGLAGYPPHRVQQELYELQDQVRFDARLAADNLV